MVGPGRRRVAVIVGAALIVVAGCGLLVRYAPIGGHLALYVVIASPYMMVAAPVAMLILLWGHRWVMAALSAGLLVGCIATQLPWYIAERPGSASVPIRVMTFNMLYGRADPDSTTRLAAERADVVLVQELTPEAASGLAAAGMATGFPYSTLDARPEAGGVGIYSRYPITTSERIDGHQLPMVSARIRIDGVGTDPTIVSLHLAAPWPQPIDAWREDLTKLPKTLADLAANSGGGAVLVGGDFNSTIDMLPFRELLADGYQESAGQAGTGRLLTYPANRREPPFMGIDHVLTLHGSAVTGATVEIPGSDHRAVLTTVQVPAR